MSVGEVVMDADSKHSHNVASKVPGSAWESRCVADVSLSADGHDSWGKSEASMAAEMALSEGTEGNRPRCRRLAECARH